MTAKKFSSHQILRTLILMAVFNVLMFGLSSCAVAEQIAALVATPTSTPKPTPSSTATPTATATSTSTPTPTSTPTLTSTPTVTPLPNLASAIITLQDMQTVLPGWVFETISLEDSQRLGGAVPQVPGFDVWLEGKPQNFFSFRQKPKVESEPTRSVVGWLRYPLSPTDIAAFDNFASDPDRIVAQLKASPGVSTGKIDDRIGDRSIRLLFFTSNFGAAIQMARRGPILQVLFTSRSLGDGFEQLIGVAELFRLSRDTAQLLDSRVAAALGQK